MPAAKPHHDDTDVEAALKRETADGSGFDSEDATELPESDFKDFPEPVENDHDGDNTPEEEGDK